MNLTGEEMKALQALPVAYTEPVAVTELYASLEEKGLVIIERIAGNNEAAKISRSTLGDQVIKRNLLH